METESLEMNIHDALTAFFFWNRIKLADADLAEATIKFFDDQGWLKEGINGKNN